MRDSLHMTMGAVTISMFYIIRLCIYTTRSPSLFCIGKLVIYISCSGAINTIQLNYIFVCIDMFAVL